MDQERTWSLLRSGAHNGTVSRIVSGMSKHKTRKINVRINDMLLCRELFPHILQKWRRCF